MYWRWSAKEAAVNHLIETALEKPLKQYVGRSVIVMSFFSFNVTICPSEHHCLTLSVPAFLLEVPGSNVNLVNF
jgi:hypothetical protein